ncbi:hypothetical protein KR074_004574 [Drosophila pseudoananassae]|nr:hypothetical protein KR074_004574 [Drosophila pseudoananassae]
MNSNRGKYLTTINVEVVPAILLQEPEVVEQVEAHVESGAENGGEAQYTYAYTTNEDYGTETVTLTAHELVIDENGHPVTLEQLLENSTVEEVETLEQGDGTHTILRIIPNSMHDDQHEEHVGDKEVDGGEKLDQDKDEMVAVKYDVDRKDYNVEDKKVDGGEKLDQDKDEIVAVKYDVEREDDNEYAGSLDSEETVDHGVEQKMQAGDNRKKRFYCPNCGNGYNSAGSLKLHNRACLRQRQGASIEDRKCKVCTKVFSSVGYLKQHMPRHAGGQQHSCVRCYRKFDDESKYAAHMESHKKQDKLEAEAAAIAAQPGGKKVVIKEFKCSFCSQNFTAVFDVGKAKRRYACDSCLEKYSNEEAMRRNKQRVEEKPGFSCECCGRLFMFEGFLQRHFPNCDGTIKRRRGMK